MDRESIVSGIRRNSHGEWRVHPNNEETTMKHSYIERYIRRTGRYNHWVTREIFETITVSEGLIKVQNSKGLFDAFPASKEGIEKAVKCLNPF